MLLTCEICGRSFAKTKRWTPKTCGPECALKARALGIASRFKDPEYAKRMSAISSERMTRRRRGGDAALNERLATIASARLRRLWADEAFRSAQLAAASQKAQRINADPEMSANRTRASKAIMTAASTRLGRLPEFVELMSSKMSEHMAAEPFDPTAHGDISDYHQMICTRVNLDPAVATPRGEWMARFLREEAERYRKRKHAAKEGCF